MGAPYGQLIAELKNDHNWREIVFKIAESNPRVVLNAVRNIGNVGKTETQATIVRSQIEYSVLINACKAMMLRNEKIEAIKAWRFATDAGLKEAKDAVEALV